jgi:B12-binding domain/radical SAM domain protein
MFSELCFAMIFDKDNRYSANAVVAAIESSSPNVKVFRIPLYKVLSVVQTVFDLQKVCQKVVAGFSFMTPQIPYVAELVKLLKAYAPSVLLVAGGPHATGDPVGTLKKLGFDVVVFGEGEDTVVELVRQYAESGEYRVCGTAYMDRDRVVLRRRGKSVDLDSYPPFPYWRGIVNPIEIMRGCSSACYFCQVTYSFGLPRYRSVEKVVEFARISMERGLRDLRFIAPNSLGYGSKDGVKPNTEAIYTLLYSLSSVAKAFNGRIFFGTFPSEIRPDSVTEDSVKILKAFAHNKRVIVGAQSGSNRVLKMLHRGHTVEDVENAIELFTQNGFSVDVDLIFGFPFESDEDFEETIGFMYRHVDKDVRFHLHTFIPLPGTPLSDADSVPLDSRKKAVLAKLIGMGKAYGYWLEQERIAAIISELRKKKVIYSFVENLKMLKISYC